MVVRQAHYHHATWILSQEVPFEAKLKFRRLDRRYQTGQIETHYHRTNLRLFPARHA